MHNLSMHCLSIPQRRWQLQLKRSASDLLIFGEGSGDLYAQQVGLLVGEILQLPVINAVSAIPASGQYTGD